MIFTCAPFPHRLHSVVVVVVVVISCGPPARRTVLNSVKIPVTAPNLPFLTSALCDCVTFLFRSLSVYIGRSVLQQVCYSPPCYGAGGGVVGFGLGLDTD